MKTKADLRCCNKKTKKMYSSSDFERLFIRYKAEALPSGESILSFCNRNKVRQNWTLTCELMRGDKDYEGLLHGTYI